MQSLTINDRIREAKLSLKERSTLNQLLNNVGQTVFMSGQQMAEYCGISPATMTRLIKKLGYDKFSEFKQDYEEIYKSTVEPSDMFEDFINTSAENEIVQESVRSIYRNLSGMEDSLDEKTLHDVADRIINARKIYLVGILSSEVVVRALGHYMWRLGKEFKEITGIGAYNRFAYSDMKPGDLLIAVSTQRIFREVLDCVLLAQKEGMNTVAITDNFTNPLASAAEYVLVAPVKGYAIDCTHVATLTMVNMVANLAAAEMAEQLEETFRVDSEKGIHKDLFCV